MDEEFAEVFAAHLDRLFNLARGLTRSRADSEDLVQETCLLALRGWRRQRPDDPGAWLATVCLNAARSSYRKQAARPVEVGDDAWLGAQVDAAADTAGQALALLDVLRVRRALQELPAVQREAITLMDLSGFSAAEVARIVQAPRGTVLARVHRGRKALAVLLTDGEEVRDGSRRARP